MPRLKSMEAVSIVEEYADRLDRLFGTFVFQKAAGPRAAEAMAEAVKRMEAYEEELSFFRVGSVVSRINRLAGVAPTPAGPNAYAIIQAARRMGEESEGLFDITVAPLVKQWGFNTPAAGVVPDQELKAALELVDYRDILLDAEQRSVKLRRRGQMLDLGGIAKGYIADKIIEGYREYGIRSALINIGGNVKGMGGKGEGEPWGIGIAYPDSHSERTVGALQLENGSVVTSGGYERGFVAGGKLYHHILNPKTGCPAETDLKSVTVVAPESMVADAFSTPLFIMGMEKGAAFAARHGVDAAFITLNDEVFLTEGLQDRLVLHGSYPVSILR